jgi:ATP-binding cassette subfamily F protein uup
MIEWLESFLSQKGITLLMVTHDRYFLESICDTILELEDGKLYRHPGNYSDFLIRKAERQEVEATNVDKAKNLMRKELDWIRRQPKARGTKSKARIDAFQDLKKEASKDLSEDQLELNIKMTRLGSKILEVHKLKKSYGDKLLIEGFNYVFKKGEKIGIAGPNGSGKSTLLKMLTGREEPSGGKIIIGDTVQFGFYTQGGLEFKEEQRVIDVVKAIAEYIPREGKGGDLSASQLLERFLFDGDKQYTYVSKLSGGERRRLYLCTVLMANPNFLILDEPTNDLDILTLNVLEEFLMDFPGCVLVVTHDRYFMDKICDGLKIFQVITPNIGPIKRKKRRNASCVSKV